MEARPGMHCTSHILSISRDARSLFICSTSSRCVNMANFRTDRGNKATDLNGSDHLYVHCVSKERLKLLPAGSRDVVCRTRML